MPKFMSYYAWIEVDGKQLPEYGVTVEMQLGGWSKVTCWVPSTAGKTFRIGYGDTMRSRATELYFKVDGHRPRGAVMRTEDPPLSSAYVEGIEGPLGVLPFAFGTCQLTDDESVPRKVVGLGEIQVDFYDTHIIRQYISKTRAEFNGEPPAALSRHRRIHERAKKALVHEIELLKKPVAPPCRTVTALETRIGAKCVQFIFQYRPLDVLRAADIIPNPLVGLVTAKAMTHAQPHSNKKPPVVVDLTLPSSSSRKGNSHQQVIDLTLENEREEDENRALVMRLEKELAAARQRMGQNKRKRSQSDEGAPRRVKREPVEGNSGLRDRTAF